MLGRLGGVCIPLHPLGKAQQWEANAGEGALDCRIGVAAVSPQRGPALDPTRNMPRASGTSP